MLCIGCVIPQYFTSLCNNVCPFSNSTSAGKSLPVHRPLEKIIQAGAIEFVHAPAGPYPVAAVATQALFLENKPA